MKVSVLLVCFFVFKQTRTLPEAEKHNTRVSVVARKKQVMHSKSEIVSYVHFKE